VLYDSALLTGSHSILSKIDTLLSERRAFAFVVKKCRISVGVQSRKTLLLQQL